MCDYYDSEEDEFVDEYYPKTPSWPSWTTFCPDPDQEYWPEELEGLEDEDF